MRKTESRKLVDQFNKRVFEELGKHGPKTAMGKALTYAKNQRIHLESFLADPHLPLDNNLSERELRIIAMGRKNFLFVGHAEAGQNLAIRKAFVSTCRLQGVNPVAYIEDVLIRVQTHPASRIDELLPGPLGAIRFSRKPRKSRPGRLLIAYRARATSDVLRGRTATQRSSAPSRSSKRIRSWSPVTSRAFYEPPQTGPHPAAMPIHGESGVHSPGISPGTHSIARQWSP